MSDRHLNLYLPAHLRRDHDAGGANILSRILAALEPAGWRFTHHPEADGDSPATGYAIVHMKEPRDAQTLCLRRAYHYPFWRLEATNERWRFDVAQAKFDAEAVPAGLAKAFMNRWGEKVLGKGVIRRDGYIFMPLQGRLLEHRSFQTMSPLDMIRATLDADPHRNIRVKLHPSEEYSLDELRALNDLSEANPRLIVVEDAWQSLVMQCDYVVTQNSSVALNSFFARKQAVLFAGIDFHHIAAPVADLGVEAAFARMKEPAPDFAAYLFWFFRMQSINGAMEEGVEQVRARFARHGWPVDL